MSKIQWLSKLGWDEENLEDLRMAGYAYIRQGKYDIALPFFQALHVLDPNSAYDVQTLGALYLELNQPAKAVEYCQEALKQEGDHTPTLLNLTKALFMLGKRDEAIKLAEILSNDPNVAIANVAKALLLAYG